MLYLSNTSKCMSTGNVIKRNMSVEPAKTRREEVVCGSEVYSDDQRGDYLAIPLRAHAVSTSSVLAYTNVNLRRKCKKWFFATERLSRSMWLVLNFAGVFLLKLWTGRAIPLCSSSDSSNGVRELGRRLEVRLGGAIHCSCY